jgi:hypothetical protein
MMLAIKFPHPNIWPLRLSKNNIGCSNQHGYLKIFKLLQKHAPAKLTFTVSLHRRCFCFVGPRFFISAVDDHACSAQFTVNHHKKWEKILLTSAMMGLANGFER